MPPSPLQKLNQYRRSIRSRNSSDNLSLLKEKQKDKNSSYFPPSEDTIVVEPSTNGESSPIEVFHGDKNAIHSKLSSVSQDSATKLKNADDKVICTRIKYIHFLKRRSRKLIANTKDPDDEEDNFQHSPLPPLPSSATATTKTVVNNNSNSNMNDDSSRNSMLIYLGLSDNLGCCHEERDTATLKNTATATSTSTKTERNAIKCKDVIAHATKRYGGDTKITSHQDANHSNNNKDVGLRCGAVIADASQQNHLLDNSQKSEEAITNKQKIKPATKEVKTAISITSSVNDTVHTLKDNTEEEPSEIHPPPTPAPVHGSPKSISDDIDKRDESDDNDNYPLEGMQISIIDKTTTRPTTNQRNQLKLILKKASGEKRTPPVPPTNQRRREQAKDCLPITPPRSQQRSQSQTISCLKTSSYTTTPPPMSIPQHSPSPQQQSNESNKPNPKSVSFSFDADPADAETTTTATYLGTEASFENEICDDDISCDSKSLDSVICAVDKVHQFSHRHGIPVDDLINGLNEGRNDSCMCGGIICIISDETSTAAGNSGVCVGKTKNIWTSMLRTMCM